MDNVFLILLLIVTFTFGYFEMYKLDCFLNQQRQARADPFYPGASRLRIGFSNPMVAGSINDMLKRYSQQHPDVVMSLFCETDEALIEELSSNKLDMVFVSDRTEIPRSFRLKDRKILLDEAPLMIKYSGLSIEPLKKSCIVQHVLWKTDRGKELVQLFC